MYTDHMFQNKENRSGTGSPGRLWFLGWRIFFGSSSECEPGLFPKGNCLCRNGHLGRCSRVMSDQHPRWDFQG